MHDYARTLRRQWRVAVIVAMSVLAASAALTLLLTPQFTATTRMFFAVQGSQTTSELALGSTFAENQMKSYEEVATSPLVLEPVIDRLGLGVDAEQLASSITATVPPDTVILAIAVRNPDAGLATRIANAVGAQLAEVAVTLTPERSDGTDAVRATILSPARVPGVPSFPNVELNLAVGLVLGCLLGLGAAVLRESADTKIRNASDLRKVSDSPLLGTIAFDPSVPMHAAVVSDEPLSASSESVRRLRTNLQFVGATAESKVVVVTSSVPGEGKSTTSLNLAVALADSGAKVVLVDADLRRPSISVQAGIEGQVGLTTILIGRAVAADVTQPWGDTGLHILPAGQVPPNPSELLGSAAMAALLDDLRKTYDVVLLDSPPLLPVTDAAILSKLAGGAIVIVGADLIHRPQLAESLEMLRSADANLYGLVLNKIKPRDGIGYGYQNHYASHKRPGTQPDADWKGAPPVPATLSGRAAVSTPPSSPSSPGDAGGTHRWRDLLSGRS